MKMPPKVDLDKCTGCGSCVDICPNEVLEIIDEKSHVVRPEDCLDCESCVEECPEGAITLEEG